MTCPLPVQPIPMPTYNKNVVFDQNIFYNQNKFPVRSFNLNNLS